MTKKHKKKKPVENLETIAVHAGRQIDEGTGAIAPPIYLSTTFQRDEDGGYSRGFNYGRDDNPNRHGLEICISALEGGEAAACFGSGTSAALSVFNAVGKDGHIVASRDAYHGILRTLEGLVESWGTGVSLVDTTDLEAVSNAIQGNTRLLWIETPSNPMLMISDIAKLSELAHSRSAYLICDNTFASPILQQPISLGADFIMHSTTKYMGGHSDVTGGAIVCAKDNEFFQRIVEFQRKGGAVPSPFDCWLILRSVATLPYRMRAQSDNALLVAHYLDAHNSVEEVYYPGLADHDGFKLAQKQMQGFGAIVSFCVKGDREEAMTVAAKTKVFTRATSLGGVESLIEHRKSIEGEYSRTPESLLRLSVGLEHGDDLIFDLEQALRAI